MLVKIRNYSRSCFTRQIYEMQQHLYLIYQILQFEGGGGSLTYQADLTILTCTLDVAYNSHLLR